MHEALGVVGLTVQMFLGNLVLYEWASRQATESLIGISTAEERMGGRTKRTTATRVRETYMEEAGGQSPGATH